MDTNDTLEFPSTKRKRKPQYTDTVHHYCEEFWFKTNVDIVLNMTAVIPVIDDLFENYFPSLPGGTQVTPTHIKGHVGLRQRPQSEGALSREKQSKLINGANQRKVS